MPVIMRVKGQVKEVKCDNIGGETSPNEVKPSNHKD
jgi:hypothetical protein